MLTPFVRNMSYQLDQKLFSTYALTALLQYEGAKQHGSDNESNNKAINS